MLHSNKYLQKMASGLSLALLTCMPLQASTNGEINLDEKGANEINVVSTRNISNQLTLFVGESTVLEADSVRKIFVSNPEVAKVNTAVIKGHTYMVLTAKKEGYCDLIRMGKNGPLEKVSIVVPSSKADSTVINADIQRVMPQSMLDVKNEKDTLVVSGSVNSKEEMDTLLHVLSRYSGKIDNRVVIGGVKQIKLEARIIEMSRTKLKEAGINLMGIGSSLSAGVYTAGSLSSYTGLRGSFSDIKVLNPISEAFHLLLGVGDINAVLGILESKGITKTLSRPSITTEDKKEANLFVGGSIPIPVPQAGNNVISIQWKDYGIKLNFTPNVTKKGGIALKVKAEAGELSPINGVSIAGTTVPAINMRQIDSEVTLGDGEELVIAGLMFSKDQNTIDKVPMLGDIPVLGSLFKKAYDSRDELELVVVLQPHFVSADQQSGTDDSKLMPLKPMEWSEYLMGNTNDRIE